MKLYSQYLNQSLPDSKTQTLNYSATTNCETFHHTTHRGPTLIHSVTSY